MFQGELKFLLLVGVCPTEWVVGALRNLANCNWQCRRTLVSQPDKSSAGGCRMYRFRNVWFSLGAENWKGFHKPSDCTLWCVTQTCAHAMLLENVCLSLCGTDCGCFTRAKWICPAKSLSCVWAAVQVFPGAFPAILWELPTLNQPSQPPHGHQQRCHPSAASAFLSRVSEMPPFHRLFLVPQQDLRCYMCGKGGRLFTRVAWWFEPVFCRAGKKAQCRLAQDPDNAPVS